MTALVAPRLGQLMDKGRANKAKTAARNDAEHAYYRGVEAGFDVAFGTGDPDVFRTAHREMFAAPHSFEDACLRVEMLERTFTNRRRLDYFHACGVLAGFKEATAERGDAEECSACSGRVLTERDGEAFTPFALSWQCDEHGWFCDDECKRLVCYPTSRNCWGDQ